MAAEGTGERVAYRTCPLCEAGCGLELTIRGDAVVRVRGDRDDVFSRGYLCPKGAVIHHLHDDPDRLRRPLVRRDGVHVEVTWQEAWEAVAAGLHRVIDDHGRESLAVYLGNPGAHNLSTLLFNRSLLQGLGTRRRFSASTIDQMPRQVASGYVFGSPAAVPVPDLDRTDFLLILGANPMVSNGSLCTAPDFPGRLAAIRERGGRVVVVDPVRTRTAEIADRWVPIRPGTDAALLAAMVTTLARDGAIDAGAAAPMLRGLDAVVDALAGFTPERVAAATGIDADDIRALAREFASATSAVAYGRIGTTTSGVGGAAFGTVTSWLIDVLNAATGNLDRAGGSMFPRPVAGGPTTRGASRPSKGFSVGRGATAVRGLPEVMGEYPASALAEEIDEAGDQRIRALVTVAGNPVLSAPDGARLDAALGQLEFMVSVDMYLNETTRHADVILPPPSQLQRDHYDLALLQFAVRNVANYSTAVFPLDNGAPDEWEILATLGLIGAGLGADADPAVADDMMIKGLVGSMVRDESSVWHGRDVDDVIEELGDRRGPARLLDAMLRTGPYGISLDDLLAAPHGIDFGALEPRLHDMLRTPSGLVELDHPVLMGDLARLEREVLDARADELVLVGRRHLRSNNSWMHNVDALVRGRPRCTLLIHPRDAVRCGVVHGGRASVSSSTGAVEVEVEVTENISCGVVSLPHGWGHDAPGASLRVAAARAGVNSNLLTGAGPLDPLSGTAVLNGISVQIRAA